MNDEQRCKTCRFWVVYVPNQTEGQCPKLEDVLDVQTMGEGITYIDTPADFGCTEWEKRE